MEIIDRIPLVLDRAGLAARVRYDPEGPEALDLDGLLDRARGLIRLRAVTGAAYIGARGEDWVEIGGVVFHSRVLRTNLDRIQKVFPFVLTAGPELEAEAAVSGDLLGQYYLEEAANLALESAAAWLSERLRTRFGFERLSAMDP